MTKIRHDLYLSFEDSVWLRQMMNDYRHKNLSQTITEILFNYKQLVAAMQRTKKEQQQTQIDQIRQQERAESYRKQLIEG